MTTQTAPEKVAHAPQRGDAQGRRDMHSRRYRWTRQQYEQMIEAGVFSPEARAELIFGEIITMAPQKSHHATSTSLVGEALRSVYGRGFYVRMQLPLALDPDAGPEPDAAVVEGSPRDYADAHPTTAVLVVEVADTSLTKDRGDKVALYARAGIGAYWIVNLAGECLEVYRQPDAAGWTYQEKTTRRRGDTVTPPRSETEIAVADLLP